MDPVEILTKARQLITPSKKWTKYIRKTCGWENGKYTFSYCALGALDAVRGEIENRKELIAPEIEALAKTINVPPTRADTLPWIVADFNNNHDHDEVLAWFDRAIEYAKKEHHVAVG